MAVLASDSFTRADAASIGANYSVDAGFESIAGIFSNQVDRSPAGDVCGGYYSAIAWPNDGYSQIKFVALANNNEQAALYRQATVNSTYYAGGHASALFGGTAKLARIWKTVAGVSTSLATGAGVISAGDVVKLVVSGTSLTLFVNGVSVCSATDAAIASGNAGFYSSHTVQDVGLFDDFEGGDLTVPAATLAPAPRFGSRAPGSVVAFRARPYAVSLAPERSHARLEVEGELNGVGNGWSDFPDLMRPVEITYGISSTGPLALVASTGRMAFLLDNDEANSAMLPGYYTPGHANCRAGFRLGIRVRFRYLVNGTTYYKFVGWLDQVEAIAGRYREKVVLCTALDWINEAGSANPIIGIQSARRSDQVLSVVQAAVARQPQSTNYDVGLSTFPYALDSLNNESGSVLSELQRIAQSEGNGHIFIRGNTTGGGELRFENRIARFSFASVATFDETMHGLTIQQTRSQITNKVKATTHPRRVGSVTTDVLFSDQNKPLIPTGATVVLSGSYTDPSNPAERIGGADMVAPVATTDYTANTLDTGLGTDLTANLVVTALYGGNSLEHTITNQSGFTASITKRQARGRTIKDLDPVDTVLTDAQSIALYGETRFFYDLPYQDDAAVGDIVANYILSVWADPQPHEATVTWRPRDDASIATAMAIEVGSPIDLREAMTATDATFFVNQVTLRCMSDTLVEFEWLCQRAVPIPIVASRTTSSTTTNQTSHTVLMPSGIVSGDLLVSVVSAYAAPTITWPAGWTEFATQVDILGATARVSAAYRKADGTEGASITVTTGTARETSHITYRITGAEDPAVQPPQAATFTDFASSMACSPLTPTGGKKNYLWLAASACGGLTAAVTIPSGYGNTSRQNPTTNGNILVMCERQRSVATESPTPFTVATVREYVTFTIGIHPASG